MQLPLRRAARKGPPPPFLRLKAAGRRAVAVALGLGLIASLPLIVAAGLPPTITSFSPDIGPTGITVTIHGTRLSATRSVRFNGVEASFHIVSSRELTAVVPPTATTGPITVTKPAGSASSVEDFQFSHQGCAYSVSWSLQRKVRPFFLPKIRSYTKEFTLPT